MAITLDKASSANAASVASLQWTHTVGGANTYLLVGGALRLGSLSTANCNNLKLTRRAIATAGAQGEVWDLPRVPTGNLTISCVAAASTTGWAFCGASYNGVHQWAPAGTAVTATATATNLNLSISTSSGQRVVGFIGCGSITATTITNPADQNSLVFITAGATGAVGLQVSDKTAVGVTTSMSWSLSASRNIFGIAIPIDPVSASTGSATVVVLTSGTSWTVPANFAAGNNTVECWGGGGGGAGCSAGASGSGGGGGGGAYAKITNFSPGGGTVSYSVGTAGSGGLSTGGATGGTGGNTFFNSTTTVLAAGGAGGLLSGAGGAGGTSGSSVGTVKFNGGGGGASAAGTSAGGGGGAAGPDGVGLAGAAGAGANAGAGGYGDNGIGGAGGSGGAVGGGAGEPEEIGGGGGGGDGDTTANNGGAGGLPGGGGGGGSGGVATPGGAGAGGQIRITYVPSVSTGGATAPFGLMLTNAGQ